MNYSRMLQQHVDSGADVTVATIEIPTQEAARQFGVIEVDKEWRIVGFEEKPAAPKEAPHHKGHCNASMGIYIFNTHQMIPILLADSEDPKSAHDFGKDILPRIISKHRVFAFNFIDENRKDAMYWRDVGILDAYYEANMDLVSVSPIFNLYNQVNVGRHSRIRRAIIDRHVTLPERTEIGYDTEADRRRFHVTDSGIVVVVRQESLIEEPEAA